MDRETLASVLAETDVGTGRMTLFHRSDGSVCAQLKVKRGNATQLVEHVHRDKHLAMAGALLRATGQDLELADLPD